MTSSLLADSSALASSGCASCAKDGMALNNARLIADPAINKRDFFIKQLLGLFVHFQLMKP
jgi:hypothetical protein